ncbi:MAG: hypothetical protein IAX21_08540 [Candidatus Bathyarchaeota archaeon]|nr:hypothetical protein [Candidatus Bathyarchaeum tardum]WNZ28692.1 MAG: hypothetical protein IAX21_08540 [Candidatus Bathyarchaeota archaeon]
MNGGNSIYSYNKTTQLCLMVTFAVLLVIISKFSSNMHHTGQAVFAIVFTLGVLALGKYGSAVSITLIAGFIYSFTSALGFFILISWFMRGITTDLLLRGMKTFNGSDNPSPYKVTIAMTAGSLVTGLTHYYILIKFLQLVPDPPVSLVMFSIGVAVVSTVIAAFVTTKFLFKRIKPLLPW